MKLKYDYNFVINFCTEKGIKLTEEKYKKFNKDTVIKGFCKGIECNNTFQKTLINLVKNNKPFCDQCLKIERRKVLQKNNFEKYGVINVLQLNINKEKAKQTIIKKYGVENISQNNNIKIKKQETLLKNHGVDQPMKSPLLREKLKKTILEKYGVENVSQNPIISEKQNNYNIKIYKLPSGKTLKYQGYENFAIDLLIKEGIEEEEIITERKNVPKIWYLDDDNVKRIHFVDIYLPSLKKCIEVKSPWTLKKHYNKVFSKKKAAKELGYQYEIIVFSQKGEIIEKHC
jgi:hypothetical protein